MKQEIKITQPDSKEGLHTQLRRNGNDILGEGDRLIGCLNLNNSNWKEYGDEIVKAVNERKALLDSHRELLENLGRILDRIGENGYQHDFPSAYGRAVIALNNAKNI